MGVLDFVSDCISLFQNQSFIYKCVISTAVTYAVIRVTCDFLLTTKRVLTSYILPTLRSTISSAYKTDLQYHKDIFYLHIFLRSQTKQVPNLSPFAIKVETWFRANNIPYECVETRKFSKATRQIPYMIHNGNEVSDSNFIVNYVMSHLDMSENLTPEQHGISRAITMMIEENTAMTIFLQRYVYEFKKFLRIFQLPLVWPLKKIVEKKFPEGFAKRANMAGIGRKSKPQVFEIARRDIQAISDILGDKDYIMGDKITAVDCAVFGILSQVVFVDFHFPQMDYIKSECPNLLKYMYRIKATYWKDWDDVTPPGHFF